MTSPFRRKLPAAPGTLLAVVGAMGLFVSLAGAQNIPWNSNFFASNEDSSGAPLDAGFVFYLGVFNPPTAWTPSAGNTSEWADHWITADAVVYNPTASNFSSVCEVIPLVEGVSLTGKKGYIWGVNRAYPNEEWILLTRTEWIWPASGGISPPQDWEVAGSTAVLGAIDQGGVHMTTAAVSSSLPPFVRPALWQQAYFTQPQIDNEEASVSGWLADPNENGRPNLLEFAFGTHPLVSQRDRSPVLGSIELTGETFQTLAVTIDPNSDLSLAGAVSADLVQWFDDGAHVVLESASETELVYRDLSPRTPANPFRAIRVRATLP